jgi:hypothetical protein
VFGNEFNSRKFGDFRYYCTFPDYVICASPKAMASYMSKSLVLRGPKELRALAPLASFVRYQSTEAPPAKVSLSL